MRREKGQVLPLGVYKKEEGMNFALAVEPDAMCVLNLYREGEAEAAYSFEMKKEEYGGVRAIELSEFDETLVEYDYTINGEPFLDSYVQEVNGRQVWGNEVKDSVRGKILPLRVGKTVNGVRIPEHEVISYRIHVRGFTKHSSSKVKGAGTFRGLVSKIKYLKDLGINQIQLLPSFEFIEEGLKINYWGYAGGYYMAPKSSYSTGESAVEEFAYMIEQMHKNGIEVIMDMPFVDAPSLMYQVECLRHYVMVYHVDGFLLNPYITNLSEINKDPILSNVKILTQREEFQNTMRKFLKGDEGMVKEVIWNLKKPAKNTEEISYNYLTNHNGFTMTDLVSYDGKHNELNGEKNQDGQEYNYCWNCGIEGITRKKVILDLRKKQLRNAWTLLMLAQGTPCILSGDEFGNSQQGNNNAYCQDNEVSWIDWRLKNKNKELYQYVKDLILLRKSYPILHQENVLQGMDCHRCGIPDVSYHGEEAWIIPDGIASRQLGVMYAGKSPEDTDCYIAYNMHWEEHKFALPTLRNKKWYRILDTHTGEIGIESEILDQRSVMVKARSISMYISR